MRSLRVKFLSFGLVTATALTLAAGFAAADPPFRVARLTVADGSVSYLPGDSEEWRPAPVNYPLTSGDTLWTDQNSRVELDIGSTSVRLGSLTSAGFLNLDDHIVQVRLTQGAMHVHLRRLDPDQSFEIDTPTGAITLLRNGDYRVDVLPDNNGTFVAVRGGNVEVTGGGAAFPIQAGQIARIYGTDQLQYDLIDTPPPDPWDQWCRARDQEQDQAAQHVEQYVSREVIGYEDLDTNGTWTQTPDYGPVWTPRVQVGWAPYRYGHWAYVEPWGWTWIDDAPWGFAPFHYGRWAQYNGTWVWVPGPKAARPVYAPALVAFVGGPKFNLSISVGGGGGGVAWFPLGPREVYRPTYRVSDTYVRNVNVTNVRNVNVTNINVTNVTYVNRESGITAVSQRSFVSARPIGRETVRISPEQARQAEVATTAPVAAPPPRSVGSVNAVNVARPPRALIERQVVVKQAPPTQENSFRPMSRPTQTFVRQAPQVQYNAAPLRPRMVNNNNNPGPQQQPAAENNGRRFGNQPAPNNAAPQPTPAVRNDVNPNQGGRRFGNQEPAAVNPAANPSPNMQQPPVAPRVRPDRPPMAPNAEPQPQPQAQPARPPVQVQQQPQQPAERPAPRVVERPAAVAPQPQPQPHPQQAPPPPQRVERPAAAAQPHPEHREKPKENKEKEKEKEHPKDK